MQVSVVLTVIGADRSGIVGVLSKTVAEHGGNWLESRMAHLAGQFAGILHVSVAPDQVDALLAALRALDAQGLSIQTQRSDAAAEASKRRTVSLEFVGLDRPGLVREVAAALARRQINVEQLETQVISAPMSGEPLFKATARLSVPDDVVGDELEADIDAIAEQLSLDAHLELQ